MLDYCWSQSEDGKGGAAIGATRPVTRPAVDERMCLLETSQPPHWVHSPDRFRGSISGNSFFFDNRHTTLRDNTAAPRLTAGNLHANINVTGVIPSTSITSAIVYKQTLFRHGYATSTAVQVTAFSHSDACHLSVNISLGIHSDTLVKVAEGSRIHETSALHIGLDTTLTTFSLWAFLRGAKV